MPRGVGRSSLGELVPAGAGAWHLFPGGQLGSSWPKRLQMFGLIWGTMHSSPVRSGHCLHAHPNLSFLSPDYRSCA